MRIMDNELDNNIDNGFNNEDALLDTEEEVKEVEDEETLDEFGDDDDDAGEVIMDSYDDEDSF